MSSCVHPGFAAVGILRQSYPQVDMVAKWNLSTSSNRSWTKTRFKHKHHSVRMPTVGNSNIRKKTSNNYSIVKCLSADLNEPSHYSHVGKRPPKKNKYTPVISNSNGKHPIFNWEHETIIQSWLTYTCRFLHKLWLQPSHFKLPSMWPPVIFFWALQ